MTCSYVLGQPEHPCGKPAAALWTSPSGKAWPLCRTHDLRAQCAVLEQGLIRFAGWRRSEVAQSVTQPQGASIGAGAVQ